MKPLPGHIAIIMDGNGRWAQKRRLPRVAGHRAGVEAVRRTVRSCAEKGISVLTLFAFSSENWNRPAVEVSELMELFWLALQREINRLHKNNVRFKIIGDTSKFSSRLQKKIGAAELMTANNTGLTLVVAANYGGQWDITEATKKIVTAVLEGKINVEDVSAELISHNLSMSGYPLPDLFIRTSGEQRVSNFLLWQLAYTELYFTDTLWPDFDSVDLDAALDYYARCERRFGGL